MAAPDLRTWSRLLRRSPADRALPDLYDPLLAEPSAPDGCFVLGRLAQSIDGRIATATGDSHWISGREDILHTHRLRALSDAVVVGAGTIRADDPMLTTREVEGPSPLRVVIDTNRSLDDGYKVFRDGKPTLLLCAADAARETTIGQASVIGVPRLGRGLAIPAMLAALVARGARRIVVEGGGVTVSRFLAAGGLDRLHVTIAPLLIGSGIPAFTLPESPRLADALRVSWSLHRLGTDLLLDLALQRAVGPAAVLPDDDT